MDLFARHPASASAVVLIGAIVFSVALWVVSANFEAAAYERVTGKRVSVWDAMFLDLRVQEQAK